MDPVLHPIPENLASNKFPPNHSSEILCPVRYLVREKYVAPSKLKGEGDDKGSADEKIELSLRTIEKSWMGRKCQQSFLINCS